MKPFDEHDLVTETRTCRDCAKKNGRKINKNAEMSLTKCDYCSTWRLTASIIDTAHN